MTGASTSKTDRTWTVTAGVFGLDALGFGIAAARPRERIATDGFDVRPEREARFPCEDGALGACAEAEVDAGFVAFFERAARILAG